MNISKVKMSPSLNHLCVSSLFLLVASGMAFASRQRSSSAVDFIGNVSNGIFLKDTRIKLENVIFGAQVLKMPLRSLKVGRVRDDNQDLKSSNAVLLRYVARRSNKKRISLIPPKSEARKKASFFLYSSDVLPHATQPTKSASMIHAYQRFGKSLMRGENLRRFPRAASQGSGLGEMDDVNTILSDIVNVTQLNHSREVGQSVIDAEVLGIDLFDPKAETGSPFLIKYPPESGNAKESPPFEHTTRLIGNLSSRAHIIQNGSRSETAEQNVENEDEKIPVWSIPSVLGNLNTTQDHGSDYQIDQSTGHEPEQCTGTENAVPPNWLELNDLCVGDLSRWSCKKRCSQFGNWDTFGFTCSCHPNCVLHEFCCSDFETECPQEFQKAIDAGKKFPDAFAVCDPALGSHVISMCPAAASEVEKTLCEGDFKISFELEKTFPLEDQTFTNSRENATATSRQTRRPNQVVERLKREAPVSDPVLGWHFKNRFCWSCWGMKKPFLTWRIDISISAGFRPSEDYRLDTLTDYAEHHPDTVSWYPPPPLVRVPCFNNLKEKVELHVAARCTACEVDQATQEACVNGSASFFRIDTVLYKNHHCYLCSKFYHPEKLPSPQSRDDLQPVTVETVQKNTCYSVEIINDFFYHNMYFPVTMILPDENNGGVEFIQKGDHFNAFTWNKMHCESTETEPESPCVAEKCSDMAVLVNKKCDNSYHPLQVIIRICVADPENNYITCQSNQQETTKIKDNVEKDHGQREASLSSVTFKKRFGTDLEQVREDFVNIGSQFGAKHFGNSSLIQSSIKDDPRIGLVVSLVWKVKKIGSQYDSLDQREMENLSRMAYAQMETVRIAEPATMCIIWTLSADIPLPATLISTNVFSCNLFLPCGVDKHTRSNLATFANAPGSFGGDNAASQTCVQMIHYHILCFLLGMIMAATAKKTFL